MNLIYNIPELKRDTNANLENSSRSPISELVLVCKAPNKQHTHIQMDSWKNISKAICLVRL